jgi:hypothetical protein
MAPYPWEIELSWRAGGDLSKALRQLLETATSLSTSSNYSISSGFKDAENTLVAFDSRRDVEDLLRLSLRELRLKRQGRCSECTALEQADAALEALKKETPKSYVNTVEGLEHDWFHRGLVTIENIERERLRKHADLVAAVEESSMSSREKLDLLEELRIEDAATFEDFQKVWTGLRAWVG